MITPSLAREALDAALEGGGERAEIFMERTLSTSVRLDGGRIEEAVGGVDAGVGLSVTLIMIAK